MKRPTIADIARRAGVTKAAVSFALNGQPGVSAATRERILAIAEEIGFQPNSAARALSDGRAGAFGLVIDRPANLLGIEPWFMQFIAGIQAELSGGQAQRVAVARVIAGRPRLVIADEPTGQLDHKTGARMLDVLDAAVADVGAALLLSTHDPRVAARFDARWNMSDGRLAVDAA